MDNMEEINKLAEQAKNLAKRIGAGGRLLKGCPVDYYKRCGNKNCKCASGQEHGPYLYLAVYDGDKQRMIYVPKQMRAKVRKWVANLNKLNERVDQISRLNVEMMELMHRNKRSENS